MPTLVSRSRPRVGRRRSRGFVAAAGAMVLLGALAACEPVLELDVDTAADAVDVAPGDGVCATAAGTCTLRAAITEANATEGFDRITIGSGIDPVLAIAGASEDANATGDLDVTSNIEIQAQGATVDASGLDRVFHVVSGELRLHDVTITGGFGEQTDRGGALRSDGVLELHRSSVAGNEGGAVFSTGTSLLIADSTIADSGSANLPGAVLVGAGGASIVRSLIDDSTVGVYAYGTSHVSVLDSTVVSPEDALNFSGDSTGTVVRSTVQTTGSTWGSFLISAYPASRVHVAASVLDAPNADAGHDACYAGATSDGYNVISDDSCGPAGPGDVIADALLEPLADNGGPTATMRPHANSPAVGLVPVGSSLCPGFSPTDQTGAPRPTATNCTAGAVEATGTAVSPLSLTVDTSGDGADLVPGDGTCATATGSCSLRAAVMEANATNAHLPHLADTITLAAGVDPVLSISGVDEDLGATGDIDIHGDLVLHGSGGTVDGAGLDRVFEHTSPTLTVDDLAVTGGSATGDGGGVLSSGSVHATDLTLAANTATGSGGGIHALNVVATGLAVTDNTAGGSGGGIFTTFADLTDSTLAANHADLSGGGGAVQQQATIRSSTVSGNSAGTGGGLADPLTFTGAHFTVVSSTISGNSGAGASAVYAPGLFNPGLVLRASTVAGNSGAPSIITSYGFCTRACYSWTSAVSTASILVAAGTEHACAGPLDAGSSQNLAPDGSCGATLPGTAALGPLAANGGPTLTHLPLAGSGAVDAIPPGTTAACDGSIPVDQRGFLRPSGAGCDVGSVEQ